MTQPDAAPPTILALVSAPLVNLRGEPVDPLDANRELADLESWLREPGRAVELDIEWAETERLQRALLRRRFDLFHYTGHGSPDALAFEDGRGSLQVLTADRLADLVCPGGQPAFRLALLSACHSEGLAKALAAVGVPHVVAVDRDEPVTDRAALPNLHAFADWGLAQEGETAAQAARLAAALRNLYMLLNWPEEGVTRLRRAVEAARQAGDGWAEANTLQAIGDVHNFRKELDAALASYAQALDLFRAVGDRLGEANTLLTLAPFSENAEEVFGIALSLYEAIGDHYSIARGLYYLGLYLRDQNQPDKARTVLRQSSTRHPVVSRSIWTNRPQNGIMEI